MEITGAVVKCGEAIVYDDHRRDQTFDLGLSIYARVNRYAKSNVKGLACGCMRSDMSIGRSRGNDCFIKGTVGGLLSALGGHAYVNGRRMRNTSWTLNVLEVELDSVFCEGHH